MVRRRRLSRKVGFSSSSTGGCGNVARSSSRESAGDWSRPSTSSSTPDSNSIKDGAECEDLAWEKALVRHSHHGVVALARTQIARLLAEDMTLTLAASSSTHQVEDVPALALPREAPALLQALAPVLALLVVAVVSTVSAVLGVVASPWHAAPPPRPAPFCLSRMLAALLPSWSQVDDMPLSRPF